MSELTQIQNETPLRHIIICLDGVGVSAIEELQSQGHLAMFRPPSNMISTFPSLTNAAISSILAPSGAKTPLGYEDTYFDITANKMRGGLVDRLRSDRFIRRTYRQLFDYHPSAIKSGLAYIGAPYSIYLESLSDLSRLRQKAKRTRQQVFLGYIGATDTLAHLGGEKLLYRFLKRLDETVQDFLRDNKTVVTVFSDHGNHFRSYQRASLRAPFEEAGFKLETRITDERSVVFPQFGLVGSAVLFSRIGNKNDLAEVAAAIEGVDFAAYEKDDVVHIVKSDSEATIEKRGESYRYRSVKGDPLGLNDLAVGVVNNESAGFLADDVWFEATRHGPRPDVIKRIFDGTTDTVVNRGSVVINLQDGYYTGSSFLDALSTLRATHGNIGRGQSYGFAMSTSITLPSHLRSHELWKLLGFPKLVRSKAVSDTL